MKIKNLVNQCCTDCGVAANYLTCYKKYKQPPLKAKFDVSTYHKGICDFCGRNTNITETRDFFYPSFELLAKVITRL